MELNKRSGIYIHRGVACSNAAAFEIRVSCLFNMNKFNLNMARQPVALVTGATGYRGQFVQDTSKPDGTMRKIMDVSKMRNLGWVSKIDLRFGICLAYTNFLKRPA